MVHLKVSDLPFITPKPNHMSVLGIFTLKIKKKRNNPWASLENSSSNKVSKSNEGETSSRSNPYYTMPTGKLPLLSQAVSMVLSDEFHFDCKQAHRLLTVRSDTRSPGDLDSSSSGVVHRRQKLKRKRFRLVFYVRFHCYSLCLFLNLLLKSPCFLLLGRYCRSLGTR